MAFVGSLVPARVGAGSFAGAKVTRVQRSVARVSMMAEKSPSVPFMDRPSALDGSMAGDVGFDPLNISAYLNLKFLREAELKHGRICMLATLGFVVQGLYTFPFYAGAPTLPTAAHDYFTKTALAQVALFVCMWEILTAPAVIQMVTGVSDRAPGDFGFDPLGLGKDEKARKRYEVNEVKNSRLAMIAIGGMIHQGWLTNMGVIEQLQAGKYLP